MRWPWRKRKEVEPPAIFALRYNGSYYEVLTSTHFDPFQGRTEVWDPYMDELMRHRFVEERPGVLLHPVRTVYEELVAEGWTPPGDRDVPPVLCLEQYNRTLPKATQLCVCHMLAGHAGDHLDQLNGIGWRG